MSVGAAFMRLEAEIAEAWRAEFAQETGLVRSELARRRTSEGRFLSGASACVLGWLRAQGHYDMAVEEFCAQVADTALVRLRHQSHVHSFELLVNNALGALLDSGNPAHIERGVQCLDALEAVIEWQTNSALYQIACVYARAGLTDRAIAMIERAVEGGRSIETMASDSDFASVVDDPRFQRLRGCVAESSGNSSWHSFYGALLEVATNHRSLDSVVYAAFCRTSASATPERVLGPSPKRSSVPVFRHRPHPGVRVCQTH